MNNSFAPTETLEMFCRFCKKVIEFKLERSIAGTGRIVDKESTFEYFCTKCHHTICFSGKDLPGAEDPKKTEEKPREYISKERYVVGEVIRHASFKDNGTVVGKDIGSPSRIIVQFQKKGLKRLVEEV
jgi:hypothetical protein